MSRIVPLPEPRRTPTRVAMLDLIASTGAAPGEEEQELIDALRRIVAGTRLDALRDAYLGSRGDRRGRYLARYAG